jgi:hypothetical protein
MSFWRKTQAEKDAAAALRASRENLSVARTQVKIAKADYKASKAVGKRELTELRARRSALKTQRAEERDEARYVSALDRLERDRERGKARPIKVRGSRRARRHRRARARR